MGVKIDRNMVVSDMPVGHKQFTEIARELSKEQLKLLILDEPTAVLTEKEAVASVNWPMAFLLVGSFAMGGALTETGAGEVVGNFLASFANKLGNRYLIGLVFFIVPFLLTQVMMNRTVMIVFIPIAILACKSLNANPIGIMILVQSACLSSFMTPMATPAVPMCMSMGGYDVKSLIKQSILPAAILCVISVLWIMTVFPL